MTNLNRYKMNKELALKIKNIVFDNEQRNKDVIDYDELLKEIEEAINYTHCCETLPCNYSAKYIDKQ